MGVYIKGMRMPENCCECGIRGYDANAEEEYCPFSLIECLSIGRQDSCPLIALPDKHGRLGDLDALIHELNNSHYPGAPYVDAGISIAIRKVCDAPTIVEAEGSE